MPMAVFYLYSTFTLVVAAATLISPSAPEWMWNIGILGNFGLLSFCAILGFLAYRKEEHYRNVFFFFWLYFALAALALPAWVIVHWLEQTYAYYVAYVLVSMVGVHTIIAWSITNIAVSYTARPKYRALQTAIAGVGLMVVSVWLYSPYIWNPLAVLVPDNLGGTTVYYGELYSSSLILNVYSLLMLVAFYVHKYRTDKPIGAFADSLLFFWALALSIDTAELLLPAQDEGFLLISQGVMLIANLGMAVSLALRVKFKSQTIADYYESECLSDDPSIDRRIGWFDRLILRAFFDPEKVGQKVFLGTGSSRMRVRRTPAPVGRR
ncbi:MAG: hypothetical protein H6506_04710 [Calditrichaeota bacterium]|nr:hypothetical protein [Calditrichota bacterium]MCB9391936.1 hypothetical protein [Calditrichota bacterium]